MIGLGLQTMYLKASALVSGAGLIAMYFVTTPKPPAEPRAVSRVAAAAQAQATEQIGELAVRLQARVRAEVAFREPARNPFRFSARLAPSAAVPGVAAAAPDVVAAPAPPQVPALTLTLIGIAADDIDGATEHTAIISTGQSVLLVRAGDAVSAGYTVAKVEEGAVELTSTADGTSRRLTFRP
jgi:hypothetical protein